ncbi:MAG: hypothetical protein ABIH23_21735 [bacterium]
MNQYAKCLFPAALIIAFVFSAVLPAQSETFTLELKRLENRSQFSSGPSDYVLRWTFPQYVASRGGRPPGQPQPPEFSSIVKKEPSDYKCDQPFRGVAQFGSEYFAFVLDSTDLDAQGYDRLYLDRNCNGDLTDDEIIQARPMPENIQFPPGYNQREFPRVDCTIHVGDAETEYSFFLNAMCNTNVGSGSNSSQMYVHVTLNPGAYREGEITLDGTQRQIVLLDFNSNGRFDDAFTNVEDGTRLYGTSTADILLIDLDRNDPSFRGIRVTDRKERNPVSNFICIDNKFYTLEISPSGEELTISPSPLPLGSITNPNGGFEALLCNGKDYVKIFGEKSKPVPLPAGDWKLMEYVISAADPTGGGQPTFIAAIASGICPAVTVKESETSIFRFGPPFRPIVDVRAMGGRGPGAQAQMQLRIVGSAGEQCTNLMVNGNRPENPSFVIAKKDGEIIERANFEYG